MTPKLSLLIPSLRERSSQLAKLVTELTDQMADLPEGAVEIRIDCDEGERSSGSKRGQMMVAALGEYVACIDDDDWVAGCYLHDLLEAIEHGPDVVTFDMYRVDLAQHWVLGTKLEDRSSVLLENTLDGGQPYFAQGIGMTANHLCAWRTELARQAQWPDRNRQDDVAWYRRMRRQFPDAREFHIPKILYLYFFDQEKTRTQQK
jgi:hypothetical protein